MNFLVSIHWYAPVSGCGQIGILILQNDTGERQALIGVVPTSRNLNKDEAVNHIKKLGAKLPLQDVKAITAALTSSVTRPFNDITGNRLKIGDPVAFSTANKTALTLGLVTGFTPNRVQVKYLYASGDRNEYRITTKTRETVILAKPAPTEEPHEKH